MLSINNLHGYYGKSHVLHGVAFEVGKGEIVALLGRNGSGRSTTAKAIMGLVDATGEVKWQGKDILGKKPFEIAHLGLGYVPENRDIFPKLTVHQNLLLGQKGSGKGSRWSFDDMYGMFPRLKERQHTEAGVLSGGEQQATQDTRRVGAADRAEAHHRHEHFRPGAGHGPRQHRVRRHARGAEGRSVHTQGMAGSLMTPRLRRCAGGFPPRGSIRPGAARRPIDASCADDSLATGGPCRSAQSS